MVGRRIIRIRDGDRGCDSALISWSSGDAGMAAGFPQWTNRGDGWLFVARIVCRAEGWGFQARDPLGPLAVLAGSYSR
jgi:hypothetical protein